MTPRRRALIVDDDDHIREVAALSLELHGNFDVYTADSGAAAIEMAIEVRPDVVVLDVMMPGMDGPATAAALRANPQTRPAPIVLLTARSGKADQERFASLDVDGFIAKPFDPISLASELEDILLANGVRVG